MHLFLTSNIGGIKKENGKKVPLSFFEENEFLNNLKKSINDFEKFVLIASDPDSYEKNDLFLKMDVEALKLSGMIFKNNLVLDGRNKDNITDILMNSSLIILSGGNTLLQNKFFNEIKLKEYLKNSNSVIVGISAGSINASDNVYNSPECEEDLKYSLYLKGLNLTTFNIEPHFELEYQENDYNKDLQRKEILKESYNREIIALTDGAYIEEADKECILYGQAYCIKNGKINKICNDNEWIFLNNK